MPVQKFSKKKTVQFRFARTLDQEKWHNKIPPTKIPLIKDFFQVFVILKLNRIFYLFEILLQ